jgi:hypothetical protein
MGNYSISTCIIEIEAGLIAAGGAGQELVDRRWRGLVMIALREQGRRGGPVVGRARDPGVEE